MGCINLVGLLSLAAATTAAFPCHQSKVRAKSPSFLAAAQAKSPQSPSHNTVQHSTAQAKPCSHSATVCAKPPAPASACVTSSPSLVGQIWSVGHMLLTFAIENMLTPNQFGKPSEVRKDLISSCNRSALSSIFFFSSFIFCFKLMKSYGFPMVVLAFLYLWLPWHFF